MAFMAAVQTDVQDNTQIQRIRKESEQYVDQSVSQRLTQAYAVDLVNKSEDITEMKKNFENFMNANAESSQQNVAEFQACLELTDFNLEQTNTLVQDVMQGFNQLENELKEIKRKLESESNTDIQAGQDAIGSQDGKQETEQKTDAEQEAGQSAEKSAEKYTWKHNRFNSNMLFNRDAWRKYVEERNLSKYGFRDKGLDLNKMKESGIGIIENFAKFHERYIKKNKNAGRRNEKFCIFGCVDVQTTYQTSTEILEDTQVDKKTLIQQQDLYESINTAYNKTVDTIIKIIEEIEKKNTAEASAKSSQVNIVSIKTPEEACMLKFKNVNIKQSNELTQSVTLNIALESMSNLTTDVTVKAIMADMMGLTQSAEATQTSTQTSKQGSVLKQTSLQTSKQTSTNSGSIVLIIIIVVIVLIFGGSMFGMGGKYHDTYFDGPAPMGPGAMGPGMMGPAPMGPGAMQTPMGNTMNRVAQAATAVSAAANSVNRAVNGMTPINGTVMQNQMQPAQMRPAPVQPQMQPAPVRTQMQPAPVQPQMQMYPRYM